MTILVQQLKTEIARLEAEKEELQRLHGYWKQRAKSAEGHLFSSDFQAAGRQLHAMTSFHSTPIEKLNITQSAKISYAVMGVLSTVNHQRAARRPKDTPAPSMPTNSREQFERHFPWTANELEWDGIRYVDASVQLSWVTWQLSRQALVVELPAKISHLPHCQVGNGFVLPEAEQYDEAIDDCREAIEAAGVRVKS